MHFLPFPFTAQFCLDATSPAPSLALEMPERAAVSLRADRVKPMFMTRVPDAAESYMVFVKFLSDCPMHDNMTGSQSFHQPFEDASNLPCFPPLLRVDNPVDWADVGGLPSTSAPPQLLEAYARLLLVEHCHTILHPSRRVLQSSLSGLQLNQGPPRRSRHNTPISLSRTCAIAHSSTSLRSRLRVLTIPRSVRKANSELLSVSDRKITFGFELLRSLVQACTHQTWTVPVQKTTSVIDSCVVEVSSRKKW